MRRLAIILALVLAGCVTVRVNVQLDCDTISPTVEHVVDQNLGD